MSSRKFVVPKRANVASIEITRLRSIKPCSDADMISIANIRKQLTDNGSLCSRVSGATIDTAHTVKSLDELARLLQQANRDSVTERHFNPEGYNAELMEMLTEHDGDFANEFADGDEDTLVTITLTDGQTISAHLTQDEINQLAQRRN